MAQNHKLEEKHNLHYIYPTAEAVNEALRLLIKVARQSAEMAKR